MPEISRFYGLIRKMFFGNLATLHFHVEYGNNKAVIDIETFEISEGFLPLKQLKLVQAWAIIHEFELRKNFDLLSSENPSWQKIKPLD